MIVNWHKIGNKFAISFKVEESDHTQNLRTLRNAPFCMNKDLNSCYIEVPNDWEIEKTHPDLLGVVVLMLVKVYVGKSLTLPISVSKKLNDFVVEHFGIAFVHVDPKLKARSMPTEGIPALAYSGGVDSTVAAILMPKDTMLFFADRDSSGVNLPSRYDKSAALYAIQRIQDLGHIVKNISTDIEFVRDPVGFIMEISFSAPIVLLADYYNIDSIAFGMIMEEAYKIGDFAFTDEQSPEIELFPLVGLPYNLVTAGLTEIGTSLILSKFPDYHELAQSCIRGKPKIPCKKCMKCFRKGLIEAKINGEKFDGESMQNLLVIREIYNHLSKSTIHLENIFTYCFSNYKENHPFLKLFAKKVRATYPSRWMERWYAQSEYLIHSKYRQYPKSKILSFLKPMNWIDRKRLKDWDPFSLPERKGVGSYLYRKNNRTFSEYIEAKIKKNKVLS